MSSVPGGILHADRHAMNTNRLKTIITLTAAFAFAVASAQEKPAGGKSGAEGEREKTPAVPTREATPASQEEFIKAATKAANGEIKLAELAATKAQEKDVKDLADMLVKDHTAAQDSLRAVAERLNVKLEENPEAPAQKHAILNALTGADFDNAFLRELSASHSKGISLYNAGRGVSKSAELTEYIDKTLPVIQTHAKKIADLMASRSPEKSQPAKPTDPGKAPPR
jgi:putative membrane protein